MVLSGDIPADVLHWAADFWDDHLDTEEVRMVALAFLAGQASAAAPACGITGPQRALLRFIQNFIAGAGFSPSFAEIAEGMGLKSKGPVHDMIQRLADRGYLSFTPGVARSIVIIHQHPHVSSAYTKNICEA